MDMWYKLHGNFLTMSHLITKPETTNFYCDIALHNLCFLCVCSMNFVPGNLLFATIGNKVNLRVLRNFLKLTMSSKIFFVAFLWQGPTRK